MRRVRHIALSIVLVLGVILALPSTAAQAGPVDPAEQSQPAPYPDSVPLSTYQLSVSRSYSTADAVGARIGASKKRTVDWILDKANRSMEAVNCQTGSSGAMYELSQHGAGQYGFCWNPDDQSEQNWYPQGITTTADALDSRVYDGVQAVAVSSYNKSNNYARLSLAPAGGYGDGNNKYRHLLLVSPSYNPGSATGTFFPVDCHAGGAMWYGNMLYVACTDHIKLFSWNHVYSADVTDYCASRIGRYIDGTTTRYCASSYAYVMMQVGQISSPTSGIRYSSISLDRASSPDKLVISEFNQNGNGRMWRFSLDYTTRLPLYRTPSDAWVMPWKSVQGATTRGDRMWFNSSAGDDFGRLRYWDASSGAATVRTYHGVHGAESLSYWGWDDGDGNQPDMLYTLSEYPLYRAVIAIRQADFN